MIDLMTQPGLRMYWEERRHWFSAEFQAEVERWIREGTAEFKRGGVPVIPPGPRGDAI